MALKPTSLQIKEMIDNIKLAKPYSEKELNSIPLDATKENCELYDEKRDISTTSKRFLDKYFKLHPKEDVYGYLDGSCFK